MKLFYKSVGTFFIATCIYSGVLSFSPEVQPDGDLSTQDSVAKIYDDLQLNDLSYEAFSHAYKGYRSLIQDNTIDKKNILTVIDFSKSSNDERFFVIDLKNHKIIHQSLVAHGKNSGWEIPKSFSNQSNSYKSSLGFYLTAETYTGKHGLSLRLDGMEKGINDNARKRHIVIHSADYVSYEFTKKIGRLGRSFGCPSLPAKNYNKVIDLIKDKSVIFIYSPQPDYLTKSELL